MNFSEITCKKKKKTACTKLTLQIGVIVWYLNYFLGHEYMILIVELFFNGT